MILSSVLRSYETLVTAFEARLEADLTIPLIKSKLIDDYNRWKENSNQDNSLILKTQIHYLVSFIKGMVI